jgi:hypothetical protein
MIRPLPLTVFTSFVTTLTLPLDEQTALLINLLLPFLAVEPKKIDIFNATQDDLIKDFFPCSANVTSYLDNYKMALVVQMLLLRMRERGALDAQDGELRKAVEAGIKARKKKATGDTRTKGKGNNPVENTARDQLGMCSECISVILDMLEMDAGMETSSLSEIGSESSQISDLDSEAISEPEQEVEDEEMESSGIDSEDDTIVVRPRPE